MNKILGFGELMLRLTPSKHYDLISETNDFSASFGGAEANVIIDLASRGHNCEFLTAFPENEIGKKLDLTEVKHKLKTHLVSLFEMQFV